MGRRLEKGDDEWGLLGDDECEELSPLLDTYKRSLFRRINGQRAAYFADVEAGQDSNAGRSNVSGNESKRDGDGGRTEESKEGGKGVDCSPSSGFADLSTWYCDAFQPASPHSASLAEHHAQLLFIDEQPTLALARLVVHPADIPTEPILSVVSAHAAGRKKRSLLNRLWLSLLHGWHWVTHQRKKQVPTAKENKKQVLAAKENKKQVLAAKENKKQALATKENKKQVLATKENKKQVAKAKGNGKRVVTSKGHDLVAARLRERHEKGDAPMTLPRHLALRPARLSRPPTDQLFG
jgi:hypothetical protein